MIGQQFRALYNRHHVRELHCYLLGTRHQLHHTAHPPGYVVVHGRPPHVLPLVQAQVAELVLFLCARAHLDSIEVELLFAETNLHQLLATRAIDRFRHHFQRSAERQRVCLPRPPHLCKGQGEGARAGTGRE